MGLLDQACCYLSGAMEFVEDNGVSWRRYIIHRCWEEGLQIDFIDPTDKPAGEDIMIDENKAIQENFQKNGRFKELQNIVKSYRHWDLRFCDNADFQITMINTKVPQWGTANEVFCNEADRKPAFFICEDSLYKLPRWLFGVIDKIEDDDPQEVLKKINVYQSVDHVIEELKLLDSGKKPLSKKWVLVRKNIEMRRAQFLQRYKKPSKIKLEESKNKKKSKKDKKKRI